MINCADLLRACYSAPEGINSVRNRLISSQYRIQSIDDITPNDDGWCTPSLVDDGTVKNGTVIRFDYLTIVINDKLIGWLMFRRWNPVHVSECLGMSGNTSQGTAGDPETARQLWWFAETLLSRIHASVYTAKLILHNAAVPLSWRISINASGTAQANTPPKDDRSTNRRTDNQNSVKIRGKAVAIFAEAELLRL